MSEFPTSFFVLPDPYTEGFEKLCNYVAAQQPDILRSFPWLTAELIHTFGIHKTLVLLKRHSSQRITINALCKQFPHDDRFKRILYQNASSDQMIELQSASGFYDCLRRYRIQTLLKENQPNATIAALCGTSMRSVQRHRKLN